MSRASTPNATTIMLTSGGDKRGGRRATEFLIPSTRKNACTLPAEFWGTEKEEDPRLVVTPQEKRMLQQVAGKSALMFTNQATYFNAGASTLKAPRNVNSFAA